MAGEFPAQMASNAENASIWWRHQGADGKELQTEKIRHVVSDIRILQHLKHNTLQVWEYIVIYTPVDD